MERLVDRAVNFHASKLGLRLEMAGFNRLVRDIWALTKYVAKVCFWLSLPFGLLLFYYFNSFQIRHFESPVDGLNYVTDTDAPQRNDFRKRTVSSVAEPLRFQLASIKKLRKQTKGGTIRPPTFEQDATEIRNRLKEIKTEARLRRIPKEFQKKYEPALFAIGDAFHSINDLEDSFEQETDGARKKLYNESIKKWKSATKKNNETLDYFSSANYTHPAHKPPRKPPPAFSTLPTPAVSVRPR